MTTQGTASRSRMLTTAETAVALRLSIRTVQRLRATGELPAVCPGDRKVFFYEADVDAYLNRKRTA